MIYPDIPLLTVFESLTFPLGPFGHLGPFGPYAKNYLVDWHQVMEMKWPLPPFSCLLFLVYLWFLLWVHFKPGFSHLFERDQKKTKKPKKNKKTFQQGSAYMPSYAKTRTSGIFESLAWVSSKLLKVTDAEARSQQLLHLDLFLNLDFDEDWWRKVKVNFVGLL